MSDRRLLSSSQVLTPSSVPNKYYVVNCEVTNPNVPYGDKFNILKRYCLTRSGDKTCKLRLTSDVQYKKGVWGMVKCEYLGLGVWGNGHGQM